MIKEFSRLEAQRIDQLKNAEYHPSIVRLSGSIETASLSNFLAQPAVAEGLSTLIYGSMFSRLRPSLTSSS